MVDVGPVLIEDTDLNTSMGQQQQTFDIYMRDMGFKINDQTWFGDKCFLFDTCKISFLDGNLGGYEFEMPAESDQDKLGSIYVPALTPDGQENPDFFTLADNPAQARLAYENGAFWRIVAKRAETEVDRYWVPNVNLNASAGDHVVLLDIFMPDLYIRVAEQRLYKEAKKYLDANDDGDIQYSFDFDKVRMLKQPTFPLQMREGAIMRVIDDDLDVGTVNAQKTVFEDKNGLVTMTSLVKLTATVDEGYEIITRDCDYIEAQELPQAMYSTSGSGESQKYFLTFKRSAEDHSMDFDIESGISIRLYSPAKTQRQEGGGSVVLEWYCWNYKAAVTEIVSAGINGFRAEIPNLLTLDGHAQNIPHSSSKIYVGYSVRKQTLTPVYDESVLPIGRQIFCVANSLTDFKCNKHYEIEMDILEPDLLVEDTPSKKQMFVLANGLGDGETFYYPDYTAVDITPEGETFKRFRISFDLPQDFSDDKDYYPAFLCASDGVTEAVHVRLWNIVERDDAAMEDLNYVDLAIDTVTIKFHDNTREKDVSLQDGQEPERLRDNLSEMSREVSATVKEESRATAWAQLMDRMTEAEQLQDQTLDFYQSLVDASRKHYLELLNLKNNIFDPDGTCKETFLQIMMLQVGADSMNYQLKYTHYSMNGHTANCNVEQGQSEQTDSTSGKLYRDQFKIGNAEEVLDHYVYTENPTNGEGGRWYPQERNTTWNLHKILPEGQTTEIYPVYFIALKASLTNPQDCHWVCEPTQHATNELVDAPNTQDRYFYFNWGILAPVTDNDQDPDYGKYTLTETRGNAYMYGDNLICGQISTLAGNSYFDLTHGNFVLSKDGPDSQDKYHDGLEYRNGVLIIHGLSDSEGLGKTIKDLGLEIEDMEIGGENLCKIDSIYTDSWDGTYGPYYGDSVPLAECTDISPSGDKTFGTLPAGKYILTFKYASYRQKRDDTGASVSLISARLAVEDSSGNEIADLLSNRHEVAFELSSPTTLYLVYNGRASRTYPNSSTVYVTVEELMVQKGTKPTKYNDYYLHLTNALKGTTEVAGGLVMTNLLMLKDEEGDVNAGMSGLRDYKIENGVIKNHGVTVWSGGTYDDALKHAEAAARNALNELSKVLPVLLTKTGIGSRIGCFNVDDVNQVSVNSKNGDKIIINAGSESSGPFVDFYRGNDCVVKITSEAISEVDTDVVEVAQLSNSTAKSIVTYGPYGGSASGDVQVGSINLSKKPKYNATYTNATYLQIQVGYKYDNYGGGGLTNCVLKFDVYMGTKRIGSANYDLGEVAGSTQFTTPTLYIGLTRPGNTITGGVYPITIKNARCYGKRPDSVWYSMSMYIKEINVGSGTVSGGTMTNWVNGKMTFTNVSTSCIVIGNNGMKIENAYGGYVCIFNDKQNTYFRIHGLPNSASGLKQGQLYKQDVSFASFKQNLYDLLENYTAGNGSKLSGYSGVLANVIAGMPNSITDIGINL